MRRLFFSILGIFGIGGLTIASPIRSMIGSEGLEIASDIAPGSFTAADYIRDGLVCMFDGIENIDYDVHDSQATMWTDLISGNSCYVGSNASFGDNYIQVGSRSSYFIPTKALINENQTFTVEVVGFCSAYKACCQIGWEDYVGFYFAWGSWVYIAQDGQQGFLVRNVGSNDIKSGAIVYDGTNVTFFLPSERLSTTYEMSWRKQTRDSDIPGDSDGGVCAIRLYNRVLSEEEIYYNAMVDKERFNIP